MGLHSPEHISEQPYNELHLTQPTQMTQPIQMTQNHITTYPLFYTLSRIYNRVTGTTSLFPTSEQRSAYPMPSYNGRIAIVGVAESDYGRVPHMTEMQLHAQALQRALEESGLRKSDIVCRLLLEKKKLQRVCNYLEIGLSEGATAMTAAK